MSDAQAKTFFANNSDAIRYADFKCIMLLLESFKAD